MESKEYRRFKVKPECGTRSGFDYHRRVTKEAPCEECRAAESLYWKNQRIIRKEQINEKRRDWRKANPGVNAPTKISMEEVIEAYGTDCHVCLEAIDFEAPRKVGTPGWEKSYHPDHLVPRSKGGQDVLENVRPSHAQCNIIKWATIKK